MALRDVKCRSANAGERVVDSVPHDACRTNARLLALPSGEGRVSRFDCSDPHTIYELTASVMVCVTRSVTRGPVWLLRRARQTQQPRPKRLPARQILRQRNKAGGGG